MQKREQQGNVCVQQPEKCVLCLPIEAKTCLERALASILESPHPRHSQVRRQKQRAEENHPTKDRPRRRHQAPSTVG